MPTFSRFSERSHDPLEHTPDGHLLSRRKRLHLLRSLLIASILLLLLFFPLLFMHFESGQTVREVEEAVDNDTLSYSLASALYWSIITPISLDLDGWPQTPAGRLLVRLSDVTKLLAVLAGVALFYHSLSVRLLKGAVPTPRSRRARGDKHGEGVGRDDRTDKRRKELARIVALFVRKDSDDPKDWNGHR